MQIVATKQVRGPSDSASMVTRDMQGDEFDNLIDHCDCRPVETLQVGKEGVPILFSSAQSGPGDAGDPRNETIELTLIAKLMNSLERSVTPFERRTPMSGAERGPCRIVRDHMGRPELLDGEGGRHSVSFSRVAGRTWAAWTPNGEHVGIDGAEASEFLGNYPFHQAFGLEEWHRALKKNGGDEREAAALLWSAKEAVVKAIGCGFRLVNPLQVTVLSAVEGDFEPGTASVSGRGLRRMSLPESIQTYVISRRVERIWISLSVFIPPSFGSHRKI